MLSCDCVAMTTAARGYTSIHVMKTNTQHPWVRETEVQWHRLRSTSVSCGTEVQRRRPGRTSSRATRSESEQRSAAQRTEEGAGERDPNITPSDLARRNRKSINLPCGALDTAYLPQERMEVQNDD